jgi:hypothetical protein
MAAFAAMRRRSRSSKDVEDRRTDLVAGRTSSAFDLPRITDNVANLTDERAISFAETILEIVEAYKLAEIAGVRQLSWYATRRRRESVARQHPHEPLPEALASERRWGSVSGLCRLLRRRLRHPQLRPRFRADARPALVLWRNMSRSSSAISPKIPNRNLPEGEVVLIRFSVSDSSWTPRA